MSDYIGFISDFENPGWIKGWVVFNSEKTTFDSIFRTKKEAMEKQEELGEPFEVYFGSHEPNTDNFILGNYKA